MQREKSCATVSRLLVALIADNFAIVATGRQEINISCKQPSNLLQLRPV